MSNEILQWSIGIAAVAAGLRGSIYLWQRAVAARLLIARRYLERRDIRRFLEELASPASWPNGAGNIMESHQALYMAVADVQKSIEYFHPTGEGSRFLTFEQIRDLIKQVQEEE